jgi:hypothetical protein
VAPWRWVLPKKAPVANPLRSFRIFYGLRSLTTVYMSAPSIHILIQIILVYIAPCYFFEIHFNIIFIPTSKSSQWFLSFHLSHQYPIRILYATSPAHCSSFDEYTYTYLVKSARYEAPNYAVLSYFIALLSKYSPRQWVIKYFVCSPNLKRPNYTCDSVTN